MNLLDAIKSGRPFREVTGSYKSVWVRLRRLEFEPHPEVQQLHAGGFYRGADALVTEWEIQEPEVTITRTQLRDALIHAWGTGMTDWTIEKYADFLVRKLGLED